jgi:hypothetical protein
MTARQIDSIAAHAATVGTRLADGAHAAWQTAHAECDLALRAWHAAAPGRNAAAHLSYLAALDREDAAARDFEDLCRLTDALDNMRRRRVPVAA